MITLRIVRGTTIGLLGSSFCTALILVTLPAVNVARATAASVRAEDPKSDNATKDPKKSTTRRTANQTKKSKRGSQRESRARQTETKTPTRPSATKSKIPTPRTTALLSGNKGKDRVQSTELDIPPAETIIPPEGKTYRFGFKGATYAEVVAAFARQTGLGVLGKAPKGGEVDFVTLEPVSFRDALSRIRFLLFNSSPLDPYWIAREEDHLIVERVNDLTRKLPLNRMFRTLDDLWKANLPDDELVLVIYHPERALNEGRQARDHLPDYVRISPLEGQNRVTIFAQVKDIKKYLDTLEIFSGDDPRQLVKIPVHHMLPSEALETLSKLMELGATPTAPSRSTRATATSRAKGRDSSLLDSMRAPVIVVIPEDEQGLLIVQAMQQKIDEIRELLAFIDVEDPATADVAPVIIPVENAEVEDLIETVRQIIAFAPASSDEAGTKKSPRRIKTTTRLVGKMTVAGGVTLFPHPAQSAIVVLAAEKDVDRVRRLVKQFDVSAKVRAVRLPVEHKNPADITTTLGLVFGGGTKGKNERFQVVPDPANQAIWFTGPKHSLDEVRDMVAALDVPDEEISLHIHRVKHQTPTFVSNMLREYVGNKGASSTPKKGGKATRSRALSVSKFTADDERNLFFVICTDSEWEEYLPIIDQLDQPEEKEPPFVRLTVQHLEPSQAASQLDMLLGDNPTTKGIRYVPTDGAVLVMGATEAQTEDIKIFLLEIDQPLELVYRVFEIRHRDTTEIKNAVEMLVGGGDKAGSTRSRKGKPGTTTPIGRDLTLIELSGRLLVRTTPQKMEVIAKHIAELDVPEEETETRIYDFPPGSDITGIAEQLASVLSGSFKPGKPKSKSRSSSSSAPQFVPQPEVDKLVIVAPPDMFPRIEELLEVLRTSPPAEPYIVALIELDHADPSTLVELITPLLDIKVRELIRLGGLVDIDESSTGPSRVRKTKNVSATERFHIDADTHNNRLIIAGPEAVVVEAKRLVAEFDRPDEKTEVVFRIVPLENASAAEVVKAVKEMMGTPAGRRSSRARSADKSSTSSPLEPEVLTVVEAPGGSAVVLNGPARDVETATEWIGILEKNAKRGREIRVFPIHNADIVGLAELILNVVDTPPQIGKRKVPRPRKAVEDSADDGFSFELTKTWTGDDLYMRADLVASTLLVAAPGSMINDIAGIIEEMDSPDGDGPKPPEIPKLIYELKNRDDAFDAVFDFEMLLDAVWDPPSQLPDVNYVPFGNILVVRYPDESRFPEIEKLIAKYIDVHQPGHRAFKTKVFKAPSGTSATQAVMWLQLNHPELDIEIVDNTTNKNETYGVSELLPYKAEAPKPCYLPRTLLRVADRAVLAATVAQQEEASEGGDAHLETEEKPRPATSEDLLQAAAQSLLDGGESNSEKDEPLDAVKLKIYVDDTTGELVVEGPSGLVEDVPDWLKELEEEISTLQLPPDIRHYRVRYIDVYTAAEILGEMFNATRQQVQAQQRALQQRNRAQQAAQRAAQRTAQQQQQQAGRTQSRQPQRGQQQAQAAVPQLPPTAVRIYPNPRDRSLILRADTTQYPAILKLLATIDRPQPMSSEFRTYKLTKLNAADVEGLLRDFLGIDGSGRTARSSSQSSSGGAQRGQGSRQPSRSTRRTGSPGAQLPETITQTTVAGELGIDPKDIKLSSNEATNTILAMAPVRALDYIGDLIKQFESEEIPERMTKYYDLQHAQSETVVEHLKMHFEGGASTAKGGERRKGGATSLGSLNTPSFIAYPPLNMLTVLATQEQIDEVDGIIERLDVRGEQDQWRDVTLKYANAKTVAETLSNMFAGGAGARAGGKRGTGSAIEPRFIGSDNGRTVFFTAPESLREKVMQTVQKLEAEASDSTSLRVIELAHAKATDVASAIEEAYGKGRSKGRGAANDVQFSITAHNPSKRLFVRADEQLFSEIESLVQTLDKTPTMGFEFRIFPLQYANARKVNKVMTDLLTKYLQRLDPSDRKAMEAYSVEVDEKANALIVVGTPTIFGFLEENLPKVDNEFNKQSPRASEMIALINADAGEVASSITQLWSDRSEQSGELPPKVIAIRGQNAVLISGTEEQITEIKAEIINPLEEQIPPDQITKRIVLAHADPGQVESAIAKLFGSGGKKPQDKVIAVAHYDSSSVIISASTRNLRRVEELIAGLDDEKTDQQEVHVITLRNMDSESVARTLNDTFVKSLPRPKGGEGAALVITPLKGSRAILVKGRPEDFAKIEEVVAKIDIQDALIGEEVRVVSLLYSDVSEVLQAMQEYLRKPGGGRGKELAGDLRISPLAQSNSLVVSGGREEVERIEATIKFLDQEGEKGSIPQVIPLEHLQAVEIAPVLQEMFGETSRRGQKPPVIIANQAGNTLIVRAGASDFAAITGMIEQLDTEEERPPNFKLIQVAQGVNVTDLAGKIEQTINDSARSQAAGRGRNVPSITLTPDPRTNALLLAGSPALFRETEDLIRQMEQLAPPGGIGIRMISLKNVHAEEVLRLIERLKGDSFGSSKSSSTKRRTSSSRPRPARSRSGG